MTRIIHLKSKTRKAKQKLETWGCEWAVERTGHRGLFVVALGDMSRQSMRWIDLPEDTDFEIIKDTDTTNTTCE